jgi:uronate dehydrogenase
VFHNQAVDQFFTGEIDNRDQVFAAVKNVDCIVHLAAAADDAKFPRGAPPDDNDNFLSELLPANIIGVYNILEAARVHGVPRVILASSGQVVEGHRREGNWPVVVTSEFRPRYLYACTKVFLEMMGSVYAEQHGITVVVARLGWCPRTMEQVEQIKTEAMFQDVYFSPGDAGRFFACAVMAKSLPHYSVMYAASQPIHNMVFDLEPARQLVGYIPEDSWPSGATDFT